jgi:alanine racemase
MAKQLAPSSNVWAVVKANAYGHRIPHAYLGLKNTDGFALLDLNEATQLRDLGWQGPILLLEGCFDVNDLHQAERLNVTLVVHHEAQLRMLEQHHPSRHIAVYLKMNSGMNRLGFPANEYEKAWQRLQALPWIQDVTLMTHFANADNSKGIRTQLELFLSTTEGLHAPLCLANSAAILWHPHTHRNWVRAGIMLYGASPSGIFDDLFPHQLQAAMTLSSEIIAIQHLAAGASIGYGSQFTATEAMRVGIVACGYADGYPRHAPTGTPIVVEGIRTRTLGRVSMDMLCVDLTPIPQAHLGSPVELWGQQLPIDDVAQSCATVGYELMCAVAPRVPTMVD